MAKKVTLFAFLRTIAVDLGWICLFVSLLRRTDPGKMVHSQMIVSALTQSLGKFCQQEEVILFEPNSPQFLALSWMATEDKFFQSVPPSRVSHQVILERFAVVVFYFSTEGRNWNYQAGFLSKNKPVCRWNAKVNNTTIGVFCDGNSITRLTLRTFESIQPGLLRKAKKCASPYLVPLSI